MTLERIFVERRAAILPDAPQAVLLRDDRPGLDEGWAPAFGLRRLAAVVVLAENIAQPVVEVVDLRSIDGGVSRCVRPGTR